jgi:predicted DNA-binding transcriptional regulator AlpA
MYKRFLPLPEVAGWAGVSKSTVLRWCAVGRFPQKVRLGPGRVAWDFHELERWAQERATASGVPSEPESGA